eukprot:TRINITY_DN20619_c0_g1_i1.p1 TRINITY_DN20619_c0_g1~~TRINITY_DN20619_c0_g1_i1.p1  ORF type:complete len:346 (-),score=56.90 TRINITY_DN20619_c0_g1_i1:535-1530(-)
MYEGDEGNWVPLPADHLAKLATTLRDRPSQKTLTIKHAKYNLKDRTVAFDEDSTTKRRRFDMAELPKAASAAPAVVVGKGSKAGARSEGEPAKGRPTANRTFQSALEDLVQTLNQIDTAAAGPEADHIVAWRQRAEHELAVRRAAAHLVKRPAENSGPRNADEMQDLTQRLQGEWHTWKADDVMAMVERMRSTVTLFMRGTAEAKRLLSAFLPRWQDFLAHRPDIVKLLDPEVVIFDVDWAAPPLWNPSITRANANIAGLVPAPIPGAAPGGPPAALAVPAAGACNYVHVTRGGPNDVPEASTFGGYVAGANLADCRGFWRVSTAVPPVYY